MKKNIAVLGSTGVLGKKILSILKEKEEDFKVFALSCNENIDEISKQINEFLPEIVLIQNPIKAMELKKILQKKIKILVGAEGYNEILVSNETDISFIATRGISILKPVVNALKAGKTLAVANKDIIVAGGKFLTDEMKKQKGVILPIDSEHFALQRLLYKVNKKNIRRIILTASGGAFFKAGNEKIRKSKVRDVLSHPVWKMGNKTTVDSATLINKALEVIETKFLFDIDEKKIEILLHPEAIVHAMVELHSGCIYAFLYPPDMKVPILQTLYYPEIKHDERTILNFEKISKLSFFPPSEKKFPGYKLGHEVLMMGENMPIVLLAANDVAVEEFLKERLPFIKIIEVIKKTLSKIKPEKLSSFEDIERTDKRTRKIAKQICEKEL